MTKRDRFDGNTTLVKEDVRAEWGWRRLEQFVRDVRFGLRQIRRNLRFSAMAIATLALGIGGMAAMFSAFDTILIRPLPYTAADQLVMIWDDLSRDGIPKHFPSSAEMLEWRRRNTVFTRHRVDAAGRRDALRRRRARPGPGAQGHGEFLERAGREPANRARLHRRRGRQGRSRPPHQPRAVAAPLRRVAGCPGPHAHA